jgi:hypothetical protein
VIDVRPRAEISSFFISFISDFSRLKIGTYKALKWSYNKHSEESRRNSMTYTTEQCVEAIEEVAQKADGKLTATEYRSLSEDKHPSDRTLLKKFGSWNEAKEMAELDVFEHGVVKNDGKKKPINVNYFSNIDTPEKAYFLGLIYADGHVSDSFRINLQKRDGYILKQLKNKLDSEHSIYINEKEERAREQTCFAVNREDFVSNLKEKGLEGDKTHSDTIPQLSDKLFRHWLRGLSDGDGCVRERERSVSIAGSFSRLEKVQERIDIESSLSCHGCGKLNFYGESAEKIISFMYPNGISTSPMLERKYPKW